MHPFAIYLWTVVCKHCSRGCTLAPAHTRYFSFTLANPIFSHSSLILHRLCSEFHSFPSFSSKVIILRHNHHVRTTYAPLRNHVAEHGNRPTKSIHTRHWWIVFMLSLVLLSSSRRPHQPCFHGAKHFERGKIKMNFLWNIDNNERKKNRNKTS